ncbi:hypothetical protein [Streptomyces mirabilis]|uniref:hypothetical protein n=1 Tax=Streptomyces mirabilis TaxID=68239 RepID=UPI0033ECB7F4
MATTEITINVEDLTVGDEIVSRTTFSFDHGTQLHTGSWTVGEIHWIADNRIANVYTDHGVLSVRRGNQVTIRRQTVDEPATETATETKGQQFAKDMRHFLSIGTRTRRDRKGLDLHREIAEWVVTAAMQHGTLHPDQEAAFVPAFGAACAWVKDIKNGRGSYLVIEHIDQLSPYQFCKLLGDMIDAGVETSSSGAQYFAAMRTRLFECAA